MRMVLWVMKETGSKDVPSLYALREVQKQLSDTVGIATREFRSSLGNIFSANDIGQLIARDYANPEIGPLLQFYPEEPSGPRSEVWHFDRLKELDPSLLTPMFVAPDGRHYYVNELAELGDGRLIIPYMWIIRGGEMCADAYCVTVQDGKYIVDRNVQNVRAADLRRDHPTLLKKGTFSFAESCTDFADAMPNPLRALAGGVPLYTSFINQWADDVSGNKSKQYNKHENVCFTHACVPGRLLQQEYCVHSISTSTHATALEQFEAVHEMIQESHRAPITTLHVTAKARYYCKFRIVAISLPADNPQQSAESSHIGPGGNKSCRCCHVGGTQREMETDEGYASLFSDGVPRTTEETRSAIEEQLRTAMTGVELSVTKKQTATGVKDRISVYWINQLIQRARQLKNGPRKLSEDEVVDELSAWLASQTDKPYNILFAFAGLNPNQDTPVEILHTVLLGIVKYAWHGFHTGWKGSDGAVFVARLQAIDMQGLSSMAMRAPYIVQYRNNLIGKHFKTLMQTLTFTIRPIATEPMFALVRSIGALGALLWIPEIDDLEQYLLDLQVLIDNVLDAFAVIDPRKILNKQKIHILRHLVRDIRRFGPAIRFSTEIFECFNAVFRMSSILSNHRAPSRDIATKLASLERVKHIASGGYWTTDDWAHITRAGDGVRSYISTHPIVLQHLGWARHSPPTIGAARLPGKQKQRLLAWTDTLCGKHSGPDIPYPAPQWIAAINVTVTSGDEAKPGSWVCFQQSKTTVGYGRIVECLVSSGTALRATLVCIEKFRLGPTRHTVYDMPFLARLDPPQFFVLKAKYVQFVFNAQHDCESGRCNASMVETEISQERHMITKKLLTLSHTDDGRFIINTHALHNAHLLRRVLPRELTIPRHYHDDRAALHAQIARLLRGLTADAQQTEPTAADGAPIGAEALPMDQMIIDPVVRDGPGLV
ncbi:hypothetical protein EXIGLDRAFT_671890 [Exidia glandulosa HHB12029]|uniref:Uncharacterized protein n=1 Tax=Exidia glandulosa HHB12029 TaxID=1314781 RepID=A0A165K439_EXIGL|nr:hypothetical protein EXIGLDRAFT_671890 [Exidia glandulosa HHB12029]